MSHLDEYRNRFRELTMERDEQGVLEVTFNTDGNSLVWSESIHRELPLALTAIADDHENQVVILTGAGDVFCTDLDRSSFGPIKDGNDWYKVTWEGKRTLHALLDIEVPIIGACNGPVSVHSELLILSDIVLATPDTWFQDNHLERGSVPGDGVNIAWPAALGSKRGRYFLLTGQKLNSQDALAAGAVDEVVPRDQLMDRARELARGLTRHSPLALRSTRVILTQQLKESMVEGLGYSFAVEGLAKFDGEFE